VVGREILKTANHPAVRMADTMDAGAELVAQLASGK
jgi:hypothetical protein